MSALTWMHFTEFVGHWRHNQAAISDCIEAPKASQLFFAASEPRGEHGSSASEGFESSAGALSFPETGPEESISSRSIVTLEGASKPSLDW